jgi:carboxyl-terminal processing protease
MVTGLSDADPDELLYKLRYEPQDKGFNFTSTLNKNEGANNGMQYDRLGISIRAIEKRIFIQYVYKESPAGEAGLMRGFEIIEWNHWTLEEIRRLKLIKGIFMDLDEGKSVHLRVNDLQGVPRDVWVKNGTFKQDPPLDIIFEKGGRKVGYLLFWSFNSQQESGLDKIFSRFEKEGIDDLILDLRYNSGGRLYIARNLASMMTGISTKGKLFTRCIFNSRYSDRNKDYFFTESGRGLNLKRLVVLTGEDTASASELIINGLRPYIPVITIGETTLGKPVGQHSIAYGDKILYLVNFRNYNALNEGDYFEGIRPDYRVTDDLTQPLGSPEEAMTRVALNYLGKRL